VDEFHFVSRRKPEEDHFMETQRSYPGMQQRELADELGEHLENLELQGYSLRKRVYPRERCAALETKLHRLWAEQEAEFGKDFLNRLGEFGTHRGLLEADPVFAELVTEPKVLEVIDEILGNTCILNLQNASASFPGVKHFQSAFHRDFAKDFVATKPLAINAFWCITDFKKENGATWVVPYTHQMPKWPSKAYIEKHAIQIEAEAGSVIFWDGLLLHKTGANTTDRVRLGINHMYTRPFLKQQMDFPAYLRGKYDTETRLGQLLGFWSIPPKSVKEFRVEPDKRTYRRNQG
jgi:ectoine hydroxylase-related dioxygenase (phytanoyl-CoA dioxygenase family)